ncbi:MAG: glucosamine-6-phosphate deaminase-like protein [Firmicutes bacterium ADurb.Bin419]|nr:MAG: glucosamine-6-phosphate deaminase-like protein [Firmicutes bacterium ADurb.Bin419]
MIQILNKILRKTTKNIPIPKYGLPNARNVLVIAPHMDDDIVGCGGTIHMMVQGGTEISILYITNGCSGNSKMQYDEQLGNIRKLEAENAAFYITGDKCKNLFYLNISDSSLLKHIDQTDVLKDILAQDEYDAVFVPYAIDIHPDHRATNYLFVNALEQMGQINNMVIYFYEVWVPLIPNFVVDITSCFEEKCRALKMHESQISAKNYLGMIGCLNGYRASFADRNEMLYAEAFYKCSIEEYIQIVNDVRYNLICK